MIEAKSFVYGFEKLDVWKKAHEFNSYVYDVTKKFHMTKKRT